ncbi:MAG: sel1 repeat family protein [Myxococcales bacterium]|nr:sel1 repeat family protein [Myxococcales bacterium]MCB9756200.1 sel1 repeat family protein [Myxococcales bacterium]
MALAPVACERGPDTQPPDGASGGEGGSGAEGGGASTSSCEPTACTEQGLEAARVQDFAAARGLFSRACDGGDAAGCFHLGEIFENGRDTDRDLARAAEAYAKGCAGGDSKACVNRGQLALTGDGPDPGPATAYEFLVKGCDGGHALACTTAAELAYSGNGVDRDEPKAIALYEKACDAKEVVGCLNAGELLYDPSKDKKVNERAVAAFTAACDGGHGGGCVKLGVAHYRGVGAAKDTSKALEAFKRGCAAERKHEDGCHASKQLEAAKGKPVTLELTTAIDRWDQDVLARDLSCRMREQGPIALGDVMAGIAPVKAKLDACAPAGAAVQVSWTLSGGKLRDAKVDRGGDDAINKCVTKTLNKARVSQSGTCSAKLLLGDKKGAESALSSLED